MYADDTLVYSVINDCIQLQDDLLSLEKWAKGHQMQIALNFSYNKKSTISIFIS